MPPSEALAQSPASRPDHLPRLQKIELLVNPLAGRTGPTAAEEAQAVIAEFGYAVHTQTGAPERLWLQLKDAVAAGPDLLIVVAGDGTARAAASLCGEDGPLLAPLAGGTMNILPHALYGPKDWKSALHETLERGCVRPVSGGEVNGERFHVAAILGPPALWAEAREAARVGRLRQAWRKAGIAWRRAFHNSLDFSLEGGRLQRAEALTLICPLVSRAMSADELALEAAAFHPASPAEAVRLGLHALLSDIIGDWRKDPAADVTRCQSGMAAAGGASVHAILDGEPIRVGRQARFSFVPLAFRALAPPLDEPQPSTTSSILHG